MTSLLTALATNTYNSARGWRGRDRRIRAELDEALGDEPGAITPDARRALLAQARRGEQSLRMLLATVSFLAETEHAPNVDLALVERAASLQPAPAVATPDPVWRKHGLPLGIILGVPIGAALGVMLGHTSHPAAKQLADTQVSPVHDVLPSAPPYIASIVAPIPAPSAVSHKQAQIPVTTAPTWRPASPPAVLHLRFYMADPTSPPRARFMEQRLEGAGIRVDAIPDFSYWLPRMPSIHYFYEQDRATAERVAAVANIPSAWVRRWQAANRWTRRAPGTIELYLP